MNAKHIVCENLSKEFLTIRALKRINLEVYRGEMFGLIGPDGAGKTTLIKILTGMISPSFGKAFVLGLELPREREELANRIGYLSQNFSLYSDLTVKENIEFFAEIHHQKNYKFVMQKLLEITNLWDFRNYLAEELSGGMKQKLALICTLIHRPEVIFLDEPTTGVDPISRREFWKILNDLSKEGITIFMSTPYIDEAERCHRVAFIYEGSILSVTNPDDMKRNFKKKIFEIVCTPVQQAYKQVNLSRSSDFVVQMFGDRLEILTSSETFNLKPIIEQLKTIGIQIIAINEKSPTLENVFVDLIERASLSYESNSC